MSEAFDVDAPTLSRYVMQNTKDHERKIESSHGNSQIWCMFFGQLT